MSYSSYSPYNSRSSRFANGRIGTILLLTFFGFASLVIGITVFNATVVSGTATGCIVLDKSETKGTKGRMDRHIVTEGCNGSAEAKTFSVNDNWFAGQFAAGDTYSKLEVGKSYDFETRGSRVEWLNAYENVVSYSAK